MPMFGEYLNKYKKALILGTGGGNDIVSAMLIAMYLQNQGLKTDVAGILSPGAVHTFNNSIEQVINRIESNISRYIPAKKSIPISFIDSLLPSLAQKHELSINSFYDFSIRYGTQKLTGSVKQLIKDNSYDLFLAVDVGGDILARGKNDPTLLSPIMDFTTLYLAGQLDIPSYLIEFGLGTDGELRPSGMHQILEELTEKELIFCKAQITQKDPDLKKFIQLFDDIRKVRQGHTAVMTLKTLEEKNQGQDIIAEYRFRSQIQEKTWLTPFTVTLPHQYFGKCFLINAKQLANERRTTAFSYTNPLEQYVRLKSICPSWKTELDLSYLWSGDSWTTPIKKGICMYLLIPSAQIPENTRKEIITEGIKTLKSTTKTEGTAQTAQTADIALITQNSAELLPKDIYQQKAGIFNLVSYKPEYAGIMEQTSKQITEYLSKA